MVEAGKRPYQNILKVIISATVTAAVCVLIGLLMHIFMNQREGSVEAKHSGHYIHLTDPELIVDEVEKMLALL